MAIDTHEISALLSVAEKAHAQGNLPNIRNAAIAKLAEIEASLAPQPAEEPVPEKAPVKYKEEDA